MHTGVDERGVVMSTRHRVPSLDDLLHVPGIYEETISVAKARVLAWQITQLIEERGLTKQEVANRIGTSRSQLDRLLNPTGGGIMFETKHRAARAVDRELRLELIRSTEQLYTLTTVKAPKGVSPQQLQKLLGHAKLDSTMVYMHLGREYDAEVMGETSL